MPPKCTNVAPAGLILVHPGSFLRPAGPFLASLGAFLRTFKHFFCVFVQHSLLLDCRTCGVLRTEAAGPTDRSRRSESEEHLDIVYVKN